MSFYLWLFLTIGANEESKNILILDETTPGLVYINADGDHGADAQESFFVGSIPESGTSGSSGGTVTILVRKLPEYAFISARGGRGGKGAKGSRGAKGLAGAEGRDAALFRSAHEGKDGGPGGPGGSGSHGGHGGHGGRIRIIYAPPSAEEYKRDWQERFHVEVSGGEAGEPGLGGDGGQGGRGGLGGKKLWSSRRVSSGADGKPGPIGQAGKPGMQGEMGIVEFFEVNELPEWILEDLFEEMSENRI